MTFNYYESLGKVEMCIFSFCYEFTRYINININPSLSIVILYGQTYRNGGTRRRMLTISYCGRANRADSKILQAPLASSNTKSSVVPLLKAESHFMLRNGEQLQYGGHRCLLGTRDVCFVEDMSQG